MITPLGSSFDNGIYIAGCTRVVFDVEVCNLNAADDPVVNFYFGPANDFVSQFWTDAQGPQGSQTFGLNDAFMIGSSDNFDEENNCRILTFSYMSTTFGPTNADFFAFSAWNANSPTCQIVVPDLAFCGSTPNCQPCSGPLCDQVCDENIISMTTNAGDAKGFMSTAQDNTMTAMFTNQTNGFSAGNSPNDCNNIADYSIMEDLLVDVDWCMGDVGSRRTISIQEGKKIIIPDGVTVSWRDVQITSCLDIFWDAIVVQDGGRLIVRDCDIDNGANAIRVEKGGLLRVDNCNFSDNYVGILLDGNSAGSGFFDIGLRGNSFLGTGSLAAPYAGQSPEPIDLPHAGVHLVNVEFANLSAVGNNFVNTFDNMYNGVVSQNSSFLIGEATFSNMVRSPNFNDGDISGYGIFANNKGTGYRFIDLRRFFTNTTFDNMPTAISLRNVSASINRAIISNVVEGILVKDCTRRFISLDDCFIDASRFGIQSTNNSPHNGFITNNEIYIDSPSTNSTLFTQSAGILCEENAAGGSGWLIENNNIDIEQADAGIVYNHGANAKIVDNRLRMVGNKKIDFNLLELSSSPGTTVSCNTFDSFADNSQSFTNSRGMQILDSPRLSISCNDISNLEEGVYFDGTCEKTDFRANNMNNGFVGLTIDENGLITPQLHRGNCFNNNAFKEAVHRSTIIADVEESRFLVKCGQDNAASACICPDLDKIESGTGDPTHFFRSSSIGETAICEAVDGTNNCAEIPGFTSPEDPDDEFNIRIAQGQNIYTADQPQYERMMKFNLYGRLDNMDSPITSPDLLSFYEQQKSSLGYMHSTTLVLAELENHEALRESLLAAIDELNNVEITFFNNEIAEQAYLDLRSQHTENILSISMELSTKESTYQASLEQEIVSKQALIAGLDENEVYDANMKYILAKVLEARHPSFEDFTSPEWEGIYGLALQCAKDAGHAVYWARSLYNASHNWVDFKGIEDCNTLQARSASEEETLGHAVNVFPNPSMEIFTFAWPMKVEAQLTIVDVQGRVQQTTTIRQGDNLVSLKDAPEGVYYFMIESEGNITRRGKLLLVK